MVVKNKSMLKILIDLFEHLLRRNRVEVEVISFLVFFFNYFMFWFYTLSLDIQNFLFFFKMHFLIFNVVDFMMIFNYTFAIYVEYEYCHFSTEKNEKLELKLKLYIEVK